MGDSFLKSTVQGRISSPISAIIGIVSMFVLYKYGIGVDEQTQKDMYDLIMVCIGSVTGAYSLIMSIRSKIKSNKKDSNKEE